jgi:peptidoglycan/LPS O-acetylase OafA/YrhL
MMTDLPTALARADHVPATGTRARIIGLDGARGLSCLGVAVMHITGHYSSHTAAAWKTNIFGMSLIFFYVLSGFLLFLPYVRNLTADRSEAKLPSTKNFAIHRIARIMPGYLVIFLLCNYVFAVAYVQNAAVQPVGTEDGTGTITDVWQLLANLTLVQSYVPQYFQTGLNPSWSLTLEFAFYASLPLLGVLLFALRRRTSAHPLRLAVIAPLLLIVLGFVGKLLVPLLTAHFGVTDPQMMNWGPNWVAVYLRSFLASADNFGFGMLAAIVVVAVEQKVLGDKLSRRVRRYAALAMVPVLAVTAGLLALGSQFGTSAVSVAAALAILVIVGPLAIGEKSALATTLELAPFRYVGKVSLSAYLWHFPVMLILGRLGAMAGDTFLGMFRNVVVVLAVTFVVSTVTYYIVEKPAIDFAKKYRYRYV